MSSEPLIVNEVLAFLKYAVVENRLDDSSIMQVCMSTFKTEEIDIARLILFTTLHKYNQIPCRKQDSSEDILKDIITLMKNTDPDDLFTFVAKDLSKLPPPITFDITRIFEDITSLKDCVAELKTKLEVSNSTISDLRAEVALLRSTISESISPGPCNMNTIREAANAETSRKSMVANVSPVETESVALHAAATGTSVLVQERVDTLSTNCVYANVASASQSITSQKKEVAQTKQDQANQTSSKKDTCDHGGSIKVEKKNKKKKPFCRNQRGTAPKEPDMVLRSAKPTTQLYLSRLHHSMTVENVVEYIRELTGLTLRVERLEPRYKMNYESFVVRVPSDYLHIFLDEEFWPTGVVYRRFRGRLHNTCQQDTMPVLRVLTSSKFKF
ncbi:uncharacterized protein LOC111354990 [Spodoptera litura]|uniref:Uncharacterized protein LOC111354990 n=1 Tax=Spodoptera litura TaxID=69820 RepID=A0A9J7E9M8_SPOLT|nr:uncharacterized protein LOC111354990 [Spodoptera litura]